MIEKIRLFYPNICTIEKFVVLLRSILKIYRIKNHKQRQKYE